MDKEEESKHPEPANPTEEEVENSPPPEPASLEQEAFPPLVHKRKSAVSVSGIIAFFLFVAVAGGGFLFYQELEGSKQELVARISELESKIDALEADRTARKNLRREFAVLRDELSDSLNKQKSAIADINREISLLPRSVAGSSAEKFDEALYPQLEGQGDDEIARREREESLTDSKPGRKRSDDAQDYIDLVESTVEKLFRLVKEGAIKIWDYFSGLIEKWSNG